MKKILGLVLAGLLVSSAAQAEVWTTLVCDSKTLAASTTTDCATLDLTKTKFISYQFRCNSASTTISVNLDWIAGSNDSSLYLAVPLLSTGTALSQLRTTYTTESTTTFSVLQSIQPPVAPYGTLRFTNNASTADVICTAVVNLGN